MYCSGSKIEVFGPPLPGEISWFCTAGVMALWTEAPLWPESPGRQQNRGIWKPHSQEKGILQQPKQWKRRFGEQGPKPTIRSLQIQPEGAPPGPRRPHISPKGPKFPLESRDSHPKPFPHPPIENWKSTVHSPRLRYPSQNFDKRQESSTPK